MVRIQEKGVDMENTPMSRNDGPFFQLSHQAHFIIIIVPTGQYIQIKTLKSIDRRHNG